MEAEQTTMNEFNIGQNLPGTIGGASAGMLGSVKFVVAMIEWNHLIEPMIVTVICSAVGAVIGYFLNYFLKKFFPVKNDK